MIANLSSTSGFLKFLSVAVLLGCAGCRDWRATDTVKVLAEVASPNGKFIATSFYCEGGGAAGYCYSNVSLRRSGVALNQRDGLLGRHKTWSGFDKIVLRWMDDGNLEISYAENPQPAYREHNRVRVDSRFGVTIHYMVSNRTGT
ncbi:MAG: hypothetical protein VX346_06405 [Planctomycetota bacterium]|nr:hypothetical protein [Planctomycetota bacterium]